MHILPHQDRELLAGLRICIPRERDLTPKRRMSVCRPRVLIPQRLLSWVEGMIDHGGYIRKLDIRHEVCSIADEKLETLYDRKADPEKGPDRYSCSSFTKAVFGRVGIWLPRYAIDQSYVGREVKWAEARNGALVFFENRFPIHDLGRSVGHVGILVSDDFMIHGSSDQHCITRQTVQDNPEKMTDVIPVETSILLLLPERITGIETALDVVRWLQR